MSAEHVAPCGTATSGSDSCRRRAVDAIWDSTALLMKSIGIFSYDIPVVHLELEYRDVAREQRY